MRIRNETETAVQGEVDRQKQNGYRKLLPCWCELCRADITALALSTLPPRYVTTVSHSILTGGAAAGPVTTAVLSSMRKVSRRPKHRHCFPESRSSRVKIINYTFQEGFSRLASYMRRPGLPCTCARCQDDTLAYALNRYPPKYGVLHAGNTKLPPSHLDYIRRELCLVISHAGAVVGNRPRH
jgi:hypothetical protein